LNQPAAVHPGDKIWLRGGTYKGIYTSYLNGTPTAPIVVRNYANERVTIDGGNSNGVAVFAVASSYTWFWGFEVMSSYGHRVSAESGPWPTDILYGEGVQTPGASSSHPGLKFINMIVHDTRQGFSFWVDATDSEIYGSLIYYNGWTAPDRGHGHGIYTQNQTGTKTIKDNIIFENFSHGFHAYGTAAPLNNIRVEGNTSFQNGELQGGSGRNLLLGGDTVANNPIITSNCLYRYDTATGSSDLDVDYTTASGCTYPTITNNYLVASVYLPGCTTNLTMTGNTFYGAVVGFSPSSFPNNTYLSQRPTGAFVFVRRNRYEAGRANITVFNWNLQTSVNIDLSSVVPVGSQYEIRNAQNFFGPPVRSGIYNGGGVSLPMTGLSVATPVGWSAPPATGPEFNAFILLTTSAAQLQPTLPRREGSPGLSRLRPFGKALRPTPRRQRQ
jgi:hypothetical protein